MKKTLAFAVAALFALPAFAQSAKYSLQVGTITNLGKASTLAGENTYQGGWVTILSTNLKTSQQKDLVFGVSLEAALVTDTSVKSSNYRTDTSTAEAVVEVQVLLDGKVVAEPGVVTFARRLQTLMAKFDGFSCVDGSDGSTPDGIVQYAECSFTDEELKLLLETMNANAFFFALDDVGVGTHTVQVQARLGVSATSQTGAAKAVAWVGKGAVTVEEVRLVKGADITL